MDQSPALSDYLNYSSRNATFMSIDVVGSTQLKNGEMEQDVIYTFLSYHKLVSALAYQNHGQVMTISGDGIMCRFERPPDGIAAAGALLAQLPDFNKRQNRLKHVFSVRIGLHTGDVIEHQSMSAGQIISPTIDLAAKLQQSAPTDHAQLSQETVSQLQNTTIPMTRVGWDATLKTTVYRLGGTLKTTTERRQLPNPMCVLMVDPDLDDVLAVKTFCAGRRYQSMAVYNLNQAALCVTTWKPHVMVISTELPWNTGWELLRGLRADSSASHVPIIMTTKQATGPVVEKSLAMGANGVISKPLQEQQLNRRLDSVLREFYL